MASPNFTKDQKVQGPKLCWQNYGHGFLGFSGCNPNSEVYIETLRKLKAKIRRVWPNLDMANVLLQHDNAHPHTSIRTMEAITSFGWTVIPHPPYSPDLAPSDYHLFGPMKEGLWGN